MPEVSPEGWTVIHAYLVEAAERELFARLQAKFGEK